ncbi:putative ABC transporter permease [Candidatus Woesearchaeota archaeon]|nr:putative ABC transporter permease [Candidatus Woesearchaeota archaeon]
MPFTTIVLEFLIFSFIGWILDSGYRTIVDKKLTNAGYFKGPFCPIYGFGGIILIFMLNLFSNLSIIPLILIASISMILVEYIGGIYSEKVLKVKLWDYSKTTYHLGGHIDILHSFYWIILVVLFYFFAFPSILHLESLIKIPEVFEIPVFSGFVFIAIWLTIRKLPFTILNLKEQVLNLSVTDYQALFSKIKKVTKITDFNVKHRIKKEIESLLTKSKATLKDNVLNHKKN